MRFGILSLAIFATVSVTDAHADRRVALVIGNSADQRVAKLPNPVNDARAVAALLRGAGFDIVESRFDLDAASLRRAMGDFTDIANDADVAVVYYAGHGIEVDGNNYLIPVDAALYAARERIVAARVQNNEAKPLRRIQSLHDAVDRHGLILDIDVAREHDSRARSESAFQLRSAEPVRHPTRLNSLCSGNAQRGTDRLPSRRNPAPNPGRAGAPLPRVVAGARTSPVAPVVARGGRPAARHMRVCLEAGSTVPFDADSLPLPDV